MYLIASTPAYALGYSFGFSSCRSNDRRQFLVVSFHCWQSDLFGYPRFLSQTHYSRHRSYTLMPTSCRQSTGISRILLCFLLLLLVAIASAVQPAPRHPSFLISKIKMAGSKRIDDSNVLGELKETIRNQKKELEQLRAQVSKTQPASSSSHGGHGPAEPSQEEVANYLNEPFYATSFRRVGWLGVFLASLSLTAVIMNTFEHTLEKHIELAYFVPLLAGHGGNTGGQTVGTVLSALSAGIVKPKDAPRVVVKEAMGGILSGVILGSCVSPIAYKILGISFPVAVVLFFTMPLMSTIAATLGAMIPFFCVWVGLDPSVIAAPAMTSIVDVTGLMAYFMIANYIFKLYGLEL
jgi:cation transporter-like permease